MDRLIGIYKYQSPVPGHEATYVFDRDEWMALKPLRADEKYNSDTNQRYADVAVRYTAWPIEDLALVDILRDERGQWWDIRAIVEVGYDQAIEIDATPKATVPVIVEPVDPADPVDDIAFTITAGQNSSWTGYLSGSIGSIDAQPIPGATITSAVSSRHIAGEGGVEISGIGLSAALSDLDVWLDGGKIDGGDWYFTSNTATWWAATGFPALVDEAEYLIELK